MKTVQELREQVQTETQCARDIQDKADAETRVMTTEEEVTFDGHMDKADSLGRSADKKERLERKETLLAKPQGHVEFHISDANDHETRITVPGPLRFGTLRAFKGKNAEADAHSAGKWMQAVIYNDAVAQQYCRDHSIDIRFMAEGVNTLGGFLVPQPMEQAIIDLREIYGMFSQQSRVIPMSCDTLPMPRRAGGITATWSGENVETTDSDKKWNNVNLTVDKLTALTRVSTELVEDAIINIADDLADEMAWAFTKKEDEAGIDGDGTSTYGGIMGFRTIMIDGSHDTARHEAASTGDNWSEISVDDLVGVMALLPTYALFNAKWYCSQRAKAAVFDRLALAAGGNAKSDIAEGAKPFYGGFPIIVTAAMPTDDSGSTLNAVIMLAFGDLRLASTMGVRRSIRIKVLTELYAAFDQIGIMATERVAIVVHDLGDSVASPTLPSPLVGLLGNS